MISKEMASLSRNILRASPSTTKTSSSLLLSRASARGAATLTSSSGCTTSSAPSLLSPLSSSRFLSSSLSLSRLSPTARARFPLSPTRRAGARSFHSSTRALDGPQYAHFGGKTSSGRWGNIHARFDAAKKNPVVIAVVVLGGAYYVYHLEQVPESGRWRFIDISRESERRTGLEAFNDIMRQYSSQIVPPEHPASRFVQKVAQQILTSTGLGYVKGYQSNSPASSSSSFASFSSSMWGGGGGDSGTGGDSFDPDAGSSGSLKKSIGRDITENGEWEVFLINDDSTRNAFVLPGGKIFVFTGILPVAKTADGLASVLGHEIAHQVARHGGERMSSSKVLFALVVLLELLGLDIGISRLGLSLFLTLPNSRTQEAEADAIGLNLMAKACYDPREASQMWVRMSSSERGGGGGGSGPSSEEGEGGGWFSWLKALITQGSVSDVDFLSTHPANGKRVKAMEARLPEALAVRAASSSCSHELGGQFESFRRTAW